MAAEIDRQRLFQLVWERPLKGVAHEMNMSAGGVAKLCDRLGIPRPNREFWRLDSRKRADTRPTSLEEFEQGQAQQRSAKPKKRTRLPIEERRLQVLAVTASIILDEGLEAVSHGRIAREVGISEAQAHNCFARRIDILCALARREIELYEAARHQINLRGRNRMTQITMATVNHIVESARRGGLLRALLLDPDVRIAMRDDFDETRPIVSDPIVSAMQHSYGMTRAEAYGSTWLTAALSLRAGRLVADRKIAPEDAIRLCLPMVLGSIRSHGERRTA